MSNIGIQAVPRSVDMIRWMAGTVRDALGYGDTAKVSGTDLLEFRLPAILPTFVYDVRPKGEMGDNEGLASPDRDYIAIREDVYHGLRRGNGRDRFTVAHELGHLILHQNENLVLRRTPSTTTSPSRFCQPEWQADTFAGEFLMDYRMMNGCETEEDVARRFGVSLSAARTRLKVLARADLYNRNGPRLLPGPPPRS